MRTETIRLWEGQEDAERPILQTYVLDGGRRRPAVLVLPGGGYGGTSPREGEPVALQFAAAGFHAFVLHYRVAPIDPTRSRISSRPHCE